MITKSDTVYREIFVGVKWSLILGSKIKFRMTNLYVRLRMLGACITHTAWPCPTTSNAMYVTKFDEDGIFLGSERPFEGLEKCLYRAIDY